VKGTASANGRTVLRVETEELSQRLRKGKVRSCVWCDAGSLKPHSEPLPQEFRSGGSGEINLHVVGGELREGVGRGFFETGETAPEDETYLVGRAVALLGHLNFGLIALFG
jgi:hypothetical protein